MRGVAVTVLAPAKVNLTLHVTARRPDGYHLLDSLVVFADIGDTVELAPAERTSLAIFGPLAAAVPAGAENLAVRAARLAEVPVAIWLDKALPMGAGLGSGSSDAAAVLRGIAVITGTAPPDGLALGADVPVCLAARPSRMRGVGDLLEPLPPLPDLPMVLVHPGIPVSTARVFAALESAEGAPMPKAVPRWRSTEDAVQWLARQRNDLEAPAIRVAPAIAEARAALAATPSCLLARMSGSGSAVFGLFPNHAAAKGAAAALARAHPAWWVRATRVLDAPPAVQERRLTT